MLLYLTGMLRTLDFPNFLSLCFQTEPGSPLMYRAVVTQQAKESEAGEETRGDDLWTYYTTVIKIISPKYVFQNSEIPHSLKW